VSCGSRAHLLHVARRTKSNPLRSAIEEYLIAFRLGGWRPVRTMLADAADSRPRTLRNRRPRPLASRRNVGCQTGMLRLDGGRGPIWHPRKTPAATSIVATGDDVRARQDVACVLYPYLLPGPAFCFTAGRFFAWILAHPPPPKHRGNLTGAVAWLVWRWPARPNAGRIRALVRCRCSAINEIARGTAKGSSPSRMNLETGDPEPGCSRRSPANASSGEHGLRQPEPARRVESLPSTNAKSICGASRTTDAMQRLLGPANRTTADPADRQPARHRRGGEYAYANVDVKQLCRYRRAGENRTLHRAGRPYH